MTQSPTTTSSTTQSSQPTTEELTRIFNTALVSSHQSHDHDFSKEMAEIMSSPAFAAILGAVATLSKQSDISSRVAADQVITTFRRLDHLWKSYLLQEGLDRIKPKA